MHIFLQPLLDVSEGKQEPELSTGPPYLNNWQFEQKKNRPMYAYFSVFFSDVIPRDV
jgi:hypothetical protein